MKAQLRSHVAALLLLGPAAVAITTLPATALAQRATPEVRSLNVQSDAGIRPGSRIQFTLRGTPHSQASIHIQGVRGRIELEEIDRGVYSGSYVITRDDRLDLNTRVRVFLRRDDVTVASNFSFPHDIDRVADNNRHHRPHHLSIDHFRMVNAENPLPGTEIRFFLDGAPGATATVDLPGIRRDVELEETRPGHYEGSYTIRRRDDLDRSEQVVATLRRGDRAVTSALAQPVVRATPASVPIQIMSHSNNGVVEGNVAHVRGRTAPFATVEIKVDAVPPVFGAFGVTQQVYSQTVTADPNGYFDFRFSSPIAFPGTRYEVQMVSTKSNIQNEAHLTLFQREG